VTGPDWRLERVRLSSGTWEGRLTGPVGAAPPELAVTCAEADVALPSITPAGEGCWTVTFDLPVTIISDGVRTLTVGPRGGAPLCVESLAFGDPLELDLRAELAALKAEVDVLKRAFRRHVVDGD
jgi:hypothetical protein